MHSSKWSIPHINGDMVRWEDAFMQGTSIYGQGVLDGHELLFLPP